MSEKLCWCFVVVKEEEDEMEIGSPTDAKHVAHIRWDGPSGNGTTRMEEFSNAPEFQSSLRTAADHPGPKSAGDRFSSPEGTENPTVGKSTSSKSADDAMGEEAHSIRKKIKSMSSKSPRSSRTGKSKVKQPDMQSIAVATRS